MSFYIKAASLKPDSAAVLNDIGVTYEKLGLADKAEESYLKAIAYDAGYLAAYSNLAYFYENHGNKAKAAEYLKRRVELGDPADPWTQKALDELSNMGARQPDVRQWLVQQEAAELTNQLQDRKRDELDKQALYAKSHYEEGQKLLKQKKYEQATLEFDKSLSFNPRNIEAAMAKKEAKLRLTQEKVKESCDTAMKMLEFGDTVSAKVEFQKILSIIPDEPVQISE